jgi:hypothetical protein
MLEPLPTIHSFGSLLQRLEGTGQPNDLFLEKRKRIGWPEI